MPTQITLFSRDLKASKVVTQPYKFKSGPDTYLGMIEWQFGEDAYLTIHMSLDTPEWEKYLQKMIEDLISLRDNLRSKQDD